MIEEVNQKNKQEIDQQAELFLKSLQDRESDAEMIHKFESEHPAEAQKMREMFESSKLEKPVANISPEQKITKSPKGLETAVQKALQVPDFRIKEILELGGSLDVLSQKLGPTNQKLQKITENLSEKFKGVPFAQSQEKKSPDAAKLVKIREKDGTINTYDIASPEYRVIYNSGDLISYDPENNVAVAAKPLEEATIMAQKPEWAKAKEKYEKEFDKDWYIDNKMPAWSRRAGVDDTVMHPNNVKQYEEFINEKVAADIFKNRPNFEKEYEQDRLKTLQSFSQKELEIIKNSSYAYKIEPSMWQKFEQGLLSIPNAMVMPGTQVFKNENLTPEEARQENNPLNILQPLSVPAKMVQAGYKEGYTFKDAMKGKQNNAGFWEDFATDPLNLVGIGLWTKLSKVGKFAKIEDAYQVVNGLSKEEALLKLETLAKNSDVAKANIIDTEASVLKKTESAETTANSQKIETDNAGNINLRTNDFESKIPEKTLKEEVDDLRAKMKEKEIENKNSSTPEINPEKIYESPEDFYTSLKPDITLEEAKEIIKTYREETGPGSFRKELSDLGYSPFDAISNDESMTRTAYILKNKIRMPEATYLYHGTEMKNLEKILATGLDNSLGDLRNPGGVMSENLGEGITTATADIETANHFSKPLYEDASQQSVILRFKPKLEEKPTLSYVGTHPKVDPQNLEYSLDGGKTWLKKDMKN